MIRAVLVALLCSIPVLCVEPVSLTAHPQKFRTFYAPDDAKVPGPLKETPPPMPVGEVTALAVAPRGVIWYGTAQGLVRFDPHAPAEDRRQYFAGLRYLPDDEVLNLLPDSSGGIWVRTRTGVSHIEFRPMTLAQKARHFERITETRHDRWGMVTPSSLRTPGDLSSNQTRSDDNDGLWTAMYAAAECFRYAITRSPEALAKARKAVEAVLYLEQVTGVPGFPARSYVRKSEQVPRDGEWHATADGKIQWKGDTSSDEIVGHFFIYGIAHDLLPDAALKARIEGAATRIMDHIISHGYYLVDLDGQPTRWGRWAPEYVLSKRVGSDCALNSLELLSFLKTAAHVTRNQKYEKEYRKVALEMKYAELAMSLDENRNHLNYSDEELAMLPFYCLFRYERDPGLLKQYRTAMGHWWANIRREKNPLWTFIYLVGRPDDDSVDLPGAAWTLHRIPMDLVGWNMKNSHRKDIVLDPKPDRFRRAQLLNLLPADERQVMKWNTNPFQSDGGNGGRGEEDGAFFLLPYWMGRHHGFLKGE